MKFEIKEQFYLEGKPFQIISGALHYFRTVPEYWQDRLEKLVNMGCNTVETYIPWNFHESVEGQFRWDGMADIERFLTLAQELGLYIILRPSPYICSEWEFGGLPAWLLKDPNMRLRCCYPPYLEAVKRYYQALIPKLVPYQIDRGGKIILMQLENEYGYYGNDTAYLEFLRDALRSLGVTVPFVTSDGPWSEEIFRSGMVQGALPTGNFGSGAAWHFEQMRRFIGEERPMMCMEFWNGWFDAWGEEHHVTPPEKAAEELDQLLKRGSLNFYMFEGGTNFGFMSGKNSGMTHGDTTSYDYDAPLTEDGQITPKYAAFQKVIRRYREFEEIPLTMRIPRISYGAIPCSGKIDLFSALPEISRPVHSGWPLTMEQLGQNYGYILYRLKLRGESMGSLCLEGAADRAQCYWDGKPLYTALENLGQTVEFPEKPWGTQLDVLVENCGRENFGTGLERQRKGIAGGIKVNGRRCFGLNIYPLPLDGEQIGRLRFEGDWRQGLPAFYRFTWKAETLGDTFLHLEGFGKGVAFINGFNLGRFWDIGPQRRLYIPAPLLKQGENTIVIFETEGKSAGEIRLLGSSD